MNHQILSLSLLCFVCVASCGSDSDDPGNIEGVEAAVKARFDTWGAALVELDKADLAEHYLQTDDVIVAWPVAVPGGDGSSSVTKEWDDEESAQGAFLDSLEKLEVAVKFSRIVPTSSLSAAQTLSGTLTLTPTGGEAGALPFRGTLHWIKADDGRWLIVQEHLSVDPAS